MSRTPWPRLVLALIHGVAAVWYEGIASIRVFSPQEREDARSFLDQHYQKYKQDEFSIHRQAILLTRGDYGDLAFQVPFYTSVMGVGDDPSAVSVESFNVESRLPWQQGGATKTFWRSVEGLTASKTCTWATSQACPLRRSVIYGDLELSGYCGKETDLGPSSGGFIANVAVKGSVKLGTQQQFLFRNCEFGKVDIRNTSNYNTVYVGVQGAPQVPKVNAPQMVSDIPQTDRVAEKPFLVEENGKWFVYVPPVTANSVGLSGDVERTIPIEEMYVAKAGDTEASINAGIVGKKGLLLSPAIYPLSMPVTITTPGFVILGLGFATLVSLGSLPAIHIAANNVRLAGVLLEGGFDANPNMKTEALLLWSGNKGVASDLFARVGSFKYETYFHKPCAAKQANIFVQVDGSDNVVDHTWLWHADHDDCSNKWPDSVSAVSCVSGNGLVVYGDRTIVYGLQSDHTMQDQVYWRGNGGKVFFYQNELPYINPYFKRPGYNFGMDYVSYRVDSACLDHYAIGLGSYIISIQGHSYVHNVTVFSLPEAAVMKNAFVWHITSKNRTPYFQNFDCIAGRCLPCTAKKCGDFSKESNMGFVWDFHHVHVQ